MGLHARKSVGRPRRAARDVIPAAYAAVALAVVVGFIAVPILSLIVWTVSEEAWAAILSPVAVDALLLSMKTTSISLAIMVVVGTPAAYMLARHEFPGKRLVNSFIDIPAVLPPSAAGIALLLAFGRQGLLGEQLTSFGITISFTTVAVVLAELFVATHFYVRQAVVGFAGVDRSVEEAARVDGAGPLGVFLRVTVPLARPSLVAGAVVAWARALGEFGGTIIFAGSFRGVTQTLPLAIYATLESDFDAAVAMSVLAVGFAFVVILIIHLMLGKEMRLY